MIRRLIIYLLFLAVLIIIGVAIFGGGPPKPTKPVIIPKTLADYSSTDAQVQLTIDGLINGDDAHRQIRITVSRYLRTFNIIRGYQGHIIKAKSFENNETAYDVFLRSIGLAGFTAVRKTKITDERGRCPLGQRFIYELNNTGETSKDIRLWSTSCENGTAGGRVGLIQDLFKAQITNYSELAGDTNL